MMWSQQNLLNDYYRSQGGPALYPALPSHTSPFHSYPSSHPPTDIKLFTPPKSEAPPPLTELTPPDSEQGEDKPFSCGYPKCSYITNRRNNLKRHIMTMHERLASPHLCCNITFFRKADMRIHNKEFHRDGYVCNWSSCNKHFLRKALLDRHMKTHTGEKPFICSVCNYGTSHKSNLDRHVKIHVKPNSPQKFDTYGDMYKSPNISAPTWGGYKPMSSQTMLHGGWTMQSRSLLEADLDPQLPDSTTELHSSYESQLVSPRIQSILHSPDKLPSLPNLGPFPSCDLNSLTSILLSPLKTERRDPEELEDLWLREEELGYAHTNLQGRDKVTHTISNILGI